MPQRPVVPGAPEPARRVLPRPQVPRRSRTRRPRRAGLAGSAADRLAGPDPADPLSSAPSRADQGYNPYAPPARTRDDLDDEVRDDAPAVAAGAAGIWAASSIADLDDDEPDWASQQADVPPAEPRAAAPRRARRSMTTRDRLPRTRTTR